ncbi:MFS transporter [Thauera sp. Sel9]|uniref:MFS transporter n=1 Tax=Thauera sp. Sel9 TaxID=2974299 RepID=UPI0021E1917F|nr:MFS transporter [Thauera sp. Sel9]MCV2218047.1 MFS transporter [Thauera sp. Sel9]
MFPYWRLSAYYFFYFGFVGAFSPYFALYLQSISLSAAQIGLLMSMMQLMRIVAPYMWSWLAEHFGKRVAILRLSALMTLAGFTGFFMTTEFGGLFAAMALMAFFWSAALPLIEGLTFSHLGEEGHRYGSVRVWGSVSFIVAVLVLGQALDHVAIDSVLWVTAAILAGVLLCSFFVPDAAPAQAGRAAANLSEVLRRREVRALLGACFLMSAAHGAFYVFYSIYLVAAGYDKALVGWMWTLGVVAEIIVFMLMPRITRRFGLRSILVFSFACAVLRFALIGWGAASLPVLLFAQVLHGVTFGAYHAAAIAMVNRWFTGRLQSRGQALYGSISFGAGGMLGALLSGYTWDAPGPEWTFTFGSVFALLGLVWLVRGWPASAQDEVRNP